MYGMGYGLGAMFSGATGGMMQGSIDKIRQGQVDKELGLRERGVGLQETRLEMEKTNQEIERGFKERDFQMKEREEQRRTAKDEASRRIGVTEAYFKSFEKTKDHKQSMDYANSLYKSATGKDIDWGIPEAEYDPVRENYTIKTDAGQLILPGNMKQSEITDSMTKAKEIMGPDKLPSMEDLAKAIPGALWIPGGGKPMSEYEKARKTQEEEKHGETKRHNKEVEGTNKEYRQGLIEQKDLDRQRREQEAKDKAEAKTEKEAEKKNVEEEKKIDSADKARQRISTLEVTKAKLKSGGMDVSAFGGLITDPTALAMMSAFQGQKIKPEDFARVEKVIDEEIDHLRTKFNISPKTPNPSGREGSELSPSNKTAEEKISEQMAKDPKYKKGMIYEIKNKNTGISYRVSWDGKKAVIIK